MVTAPLTRPRRRLAGWAAAVVATIGAACTSDPPAPPPPGQGEGVATTSLTTTTLQDLDDLVHATERPAIPTLPPGPGATADAIGQISAIVAMIERRDGPAIGEPSAFVDAIAQELLAAFSGCAVAPTVHAVTTGVGPAIGTIDLTFGCDPTTSGLQYVLTLAAPGSVDNPGQGWLVTAATRTPQCTRGVSDGLCS